MNRYKIMVSEYCHNYDLFWDKILHTNFELIGYADKVSIYQSLGSQLTLFTTLQYVVSQWTNGIEYQRYYRSLEWTVTIDVSDDGGKINPPAKFPMPVGSTIKGF